MTTRTEQVLFYNLDNNRSQSQVDKEIKALLNTEAAKKDKPALVGFCEAYYSFKEFGHFHLVRSTKNKSRKNIAAYVREDLWGGGLEWFDFKETWSRTNPGASGQHEPRSYPRFNVGQMRVWVVHQPPKGTDNTHDAQKEGIDLLAGKMAPQDNWSQHAKDMPRIALGDFNRKRGEDGPGPDGLANRIDGLNETAKIDTAVRRGQGKIDNVEYPEKVHGVVLKSDHHHALRFDLTAPEKWWIPE